MIMTLDDISLALTGAATSMAILLIVRSWVRDRAKSRMAVETIEDLLQRGDKKIQSLEKFKKTHDEIEEAAIQDVNESVFNRLHEHDSRVMREASEARTAAEILEGGLYNARGHIERSITKVSQVENKNLDPIKSQFDRLIEVLMTVNELNSSFQAMASSISRTEDEIRTLDDDLSMVMDSMNIQWRQ